MSSNLIMEKLFEFIHTALKKNPLFVGGFRLQSNLTGAKIAFFLFTLLVIFFLLVIVT